MDDHLVLKKRKLQIDSEEDSEHSNNDPSKIEITTNNIKIKSKNSDIPITNGKRHSEDKENENGFNNNSSHLSQKPNKKEEKYREKNEKNLEKLNNNNISQQKPSRNDIQERLEGLQKEKKPKVSEMDQIIDHLFEPDHSDSWSEINQIRNEIQEEKKEKQLKEQKRKERKQREREEREQRERERESKIKEKKSFVRVSDNTGLSKRDELIYDVLIRWWYCMPEWPPKNYDYQSKLIKLQLKPYEYKNFRNAKDIDQNGFKKVYYIEGYEGCYKDKDGNFIDLRPVEGKPCYSEFKKKTDAELKQMLKAALEEQIKQLEQYLKDSDDLDTSYLESLKKKHKRL
ncbi:hypothetical protein PPERSA_08335 [Pseudocohnilembus persalinus]|uniref:Uncharacterized protein n=1 Tax=Pseudocohnilembus persalinus TaxID=266149 RepID=A0A0V0QPU3_PSEPJ|nr:hypothetical protein PPERSA_08335 [Pseudocohnilembus persalinus]|eukprot:KRX04120.1 hypothetical protein PPERSA_08335 [Pseudocohnilembus persalinus]